MNAIEIDNLEKSIKAYFAHAINVLIVRKWNDDEEELIELRGSELDLFDLGSGDSYLVLSLFISDEELIAEYYADMHFRRMMSVVAFNKPIKSFEEFAAALRADSNDWE